MKLHVTAAGGTIRQPPLSTATGGFAWLAGPRILDRPGTRDAVIRYITVLHWSPEQIAGRLSLEGSPIRISYSTIYRGIYLDNLGVPLKSHGARGLPRLLRHRGKMRKIKGTINERRGRFNDVPSIHDRPRSAENRSWFGHWEGDTVRGKTGHSALVTLVDRKLRYLLSSKRPTQKLTLLETS